MSQHRNIVYATKSQSRSSQQEVFLASELLRLPYEHNHRFSKAADIQLRQLLFNCLAAQSPDYLHYFFPNGRPTDHTTPWSLRTAQGAIDGAEYTAAAKGTACGHIFKNGESTYHCKTCASDDTCVLCTKCFESSDHEGHMVLISVSPGNSGCCDCGDKEAWRKEIRCAIHTADEEEPGGGGVPKEKQRASMTPEVGAGLPADLVEAIRMTIARCADYLCDVLSCSPEQLRLPKTHESIVQDELLSRLSSVYGEERPATPIEYALILWNDEKHTVDDVQNQVARACQEKKSFGLQKAMEVDDVGRSIVQYSHDVPKLLHMAAIIEQLKLTVTIRSARDTFREQMCATIIDWFADIAGCSVGDDPHLLRNVVCEECLRPWRTGSRAGNKDIGQNGIDDHEIEDSERSRMRHEAFWRPLRRAANVIRGQLGGGDQAVVLEVDNEDENDDEDYEDDEDYDMEGEEDIAESEMDEFENATNAALLDRAVEMDLDTTEEPDDADDNRNPLQRRLMADLLTSLGRPRQNITPQDSDDGEAEQNTSPVRPAVMAPFENVPRTPAEKVAKKKHPRPSKYWLEKPEAFRPIKSTEPCEDLWQRVRLDYLILYDLRLWKTLRVQLRHLYITTVVTIPRFKRILGLRFAGLYTPLAQLYLIADREPDHSIINLSVQMLTTPTITQEVVDRGNFLTHLMAILYTFLTTRQVGFPEEINPRGTLAFDAGAVTNRRMFHFFLDLRWLFQSDLIQQKMRTESRYLMQFLDLVKLHQGVCPNVRATGEHVEYESDSWISASMIVKEINKLCKQVAVSFETDGKDSKDRSDLIRALRTVAQVTMINAFGYERKRFVAAEIKDDLAWHTIGPFETEGKIYSVPKHVVQLEPMSFHHPLHYLLSWLLETAKSMTRDELRNLLTFSPEDLKDPWTHTRSLPAPASLTSDELLCAIFDHPLRTCVWLSQMKAGMWVRNGITLRHQAHTYRSVSHRDVGYQRDILVVQTGLVLCGNADERPGERYLAQMIDRFELGSWVKGDYEVINGFEEPQQLDVIEDFFHLMIIALSERGNIIPHEDEKNQHDKILQHDIAHALCFKPLSFSDLAGRVTEKVGESDDFNRVLESMTVYRKPEGLHDTGTFELKPEYIELVDPYYAHYSRNHREEAESIYKKYMARKTGKKVEDVVYEPRLTPIDSGLFSQLTAFTETPLFAQVIGAALHFAIQLKLTTSKIQATRVETFLHLVLHLILIATIEDRSPADSPAGFVEVAESMPCDFKAFPMTVFSTQATVIQLLIALSGMEEYASCHASIKLILRKMQSRQPTKLRTVLSSFNALLDRSETASPASLSAEEKERKKREALARQARVMAQMKQQQNSFLQNQGLSIGDDAALDDFEDDMSVIEEPTGMDERKTWSFPVGTCILCQEEADGERLYGTFAFLGESNILRTTPVDDIDFIKEVLNTPDNLDRQRDDIRPFGVAGSNKQEVRKRTPGGATTVVERQGLSKGFPHQKHGLKAPVSTSCGHIMHYNCFELYLTATTRRHTQQIARSHPERIECEEFICPLCKALGNTFLPIIWKPKECAQDHEVHAAQPFETWFEETAKNYADTANSTGAVQGFYQQQKLQDLYVARSFKYIDTMFASQLVQDMQGLSLEQRTVQSQQSPDQSQTGRFPTLRRGYSLSRLFGIGQLPRVTTPTVSPPVELENNPFDKTKTGDLFKAYQRVDKTIRVNQLADSNGSELPSSIAVLSRALGLSITSFEISHRGVGGDPFSLSLITDLPEQVLTHLRIVCETIESYIAINLIGTGSNGASKDIMRSRETIVNQLFYCHESSDDRMSDVAEKMLFQDDIFLFFADWLSLMAPDLKEALHVLQLCYWAELVKTLFVYSTSGRNQIAGGLVTATDQDMEYFTAALTTLNTVLESEHGSSLGSLQTLRVLVDRYALAFLRKCAVLMHVRYGMDYDCPYNVNPESTELDRLTKLLHVSSIEKLCQYFTSSDASALRHLTANWVSDAHSHFVRETGPVVTSDAQPTAAPIYSIHLAHPAIYELVGLPKNYDILTEEAIRRRCPTTGKEISDPALCLHCGEIFCSQATCCMVDRNKGGCYQHMIKHGAQTGLFINIRKCMVLLAHGPGNGSFQQAPYLDRHGEPDPTLRRHHQLFLNQRRYDKLLRDVWLSHLIPTVISRKLEGDNNPGGWETL